MNKVTKLILAVVGLGVLAVANGFIATGLWLVAGDVGYGVGLVWSVGSSAVYGWKAVDWIDPFDLRTERTYR